MAIIFHEDRCIQCNGCRTACDSWHHLSGGVHCRSLSVSWEGEYPNARMRVANVACHHCADAACMERCPAKAIYRDEKTSAVRVDEGRCVGCGACKKACPFGIPQISPEKKMVKCSLCDTPVCVWNCPAKALERVD